MSSEGNTSNDYDEGENYLSAAATNAVGSRGVARFTAAEVLAHPFIAQCLAQSYATVLR